MKKAILALALVMSIGATQVSLASSAPKHRYHPTTQQVDSKAAPASAAQPSASKDKGDEALELILIQPVQIRPTMMIMMRMIISLFILDTV